MNRRASLQGFTILELLIAASIMLAIYLISSQMIQVSGNALTTITNHTELIEDARVAGQMIADYTTSAVYIYPPNTQLKLNDIVTYDVRNPTTGTNVWVIGQDPMIAFIESPKSPGNNCPADPLNCLTFVAYYAVARDEVTSSTGYLYGDNKDQQLQSDPRNSDAWSLFEYRLPLKVGVLGDDTPPPTNPNSANNAGRLRGSTGHLVADYLAPKTGLLLDTNTSLCRNGEAGDNASDLLPCSDVIKSVTDYTYPTTSLVQGQFSLQTSYIAPKRNSGDNKRTKNYTSPIMPFQLVSRNLYPPPGS